MTYKTQEINAKCLKQFDLRLFFRKKKSRLDEENKKSPFRAFASRAKNNGAIVIPWFSTLCG